MKNDVQTRDMAVSLLKQGKSAAVNLVAGVLIGLMRAISRGH